MRFMGDSIERCIQRTSQVAEGNEDDADDFEEEEDAGEEEEGDEAMEGGGEEEEEPSQRPSHPHRPQSHQNRRNQW